MIRYLYLFFLCFLVAITSQGQNNPVFGQFFTNPYLLNPAYVGIEGRAAMFLTHRQQWMGIDGAPVSSNFNFHGPLVAGLSAGLNVYNDSRGLLSTNVASVTAGYALALSEKEYIRFGLSGGIGFRNFNLGEVDNPADPAIGDIVENSTFMAGNFGMSFHSGYFTLGFAFPSIFDTGITPTNSLTNDEGGLNVLEKYTVNASYRFYFGLDEMAFEPHLVYYTYKGIPSQLEAAGILHIKYNLWAGASYRQDFGISGLVGFKIGGSFSIGYSYTIPSESMSLGIATHEFQLGLLLRRNKEDVQAISFIDNERSYWGVEAEDADSFFAQDSGSDVSPDDAVFDFEIDESDDNQTDASGQDQDESQITRQPRFNMETVTILEDHELSESDENQIINSGERYELIRPGNHLMELQYGYYIIVNTFEVFEDLKTYRDGINESGSHIKYGFGSQTNTWYAYTVRNETSVGFLDELNNARQDPRFSDVWILIVE
ncbi:PorP/SprF family type IX secretion system membrane protein [Bacteroidota bacterium]